MLLSTLTSLLVSLLGLTAPNKPGQTDPTELQFELRHLHAVSRSARVVFSDVLPRAIDSEANGSKRDHNTYTIPTVTMPTFRPPSFEALSQARTHSRNFRQSMSFSWDEDEVIGPDVEKRDTLLELAKMTNNAYVEPDDPAWYDLGGHWDVVSLSTLTGRFWKRQPCFPFRATLLVGNRTRMGSAGMFSPRPITTPLFWLSRVLQRQSLVEVGRLQRRTRSTTTCCLVAAVHGLTGHGRRFAGAIEGDTSATKNA